MVFESLVADLLNRFLGPYVENLDASQLKLGIWSGDVVLQNLFVKEGALDELDLPVKIKVGNIGKLTLKIPWKNIYAAPVEATLEGLYIVAAPNADIKYNAEKDKKQKFEAKQRTLQRVEDAKTKEKEKDKVKDPKADSFAEKLAMQVVKNVQVKIRDIHVRYEDRTTNPKAPFALGATLQNISLETTDENWLPCVVDQTVQLVHKMLRLDSLAVYFNSGSDMYTTKDRQEMLDIMKSSIGTEGSIPKGYQYLIEPISSQAQLRLNPKPESNLSVPQAYVNLVIQSIGVGVRRKQYRDVMQLLVSFERMTRNEPFRKYKPDVPLHGHAKEWWHYAQNSILEETVRRRHRMWSWAHISKHRKLVKHYINLYVDKLDTNKPSKDLLKKLEDMEKELDVFNITLSRQQAEVEFKKRGLKKKKEKAESGGWFGGLWGGKKKDQKKQAEEDDLASMANKFQDAMTEEEKAKLYAAIGFSETSVNTTLPKDYVGIDANFKLLETSVKLFEDDDELQILNLAVTDLGAVFKQRPAAEAIKLDLQLGEFSVLGAPTNGQRPQMVESQVTLEDEKVSEVSLQFETNPMDGKADQRITLRTQPLKVVYDAHTINSIAAFFKPPQDVHLDELSAAAMSNLTELSDTSTTGLQFMVDNKQILDINVDVKSTYVIIPENGVFDGSGSVLVVDLGNVKMTTESEERHVGERTENETLEELKRKAYDRFNLDIQDVQVIFAPKGEDWQAIRKQHGSSPLHLLQPMDLHISLQKCMVEDARLPKMKVKGELPDVSIDLSDHKLKEILALATSIPLPESDEPEAPAAQRGPKGSAGAGAARGGQEGATASVSVVKALVSLEESDGYETASEWWTESETYAVGRGVSDSKLIAVAGDDSDDEFLSADEGSSPSLLSKKKQAIQRQQSTSVYLRSDVELQFELKRVTLNLGQREADGSESPVLGVAIHSLGAKVQVRPLDMDVELSLGSIAAQHHKFQVPGSEELYLVRTPAYDEKAERLLSVKYHKIDKNNPEFATTYKSTEQMITAHFTTLEVVAHCEAILDITEFADTLVASLDQSGKTPAVEDGHVEDEGYISEDDKKPERKRTKGVKPTDVIDVQVVATLDTIALVVCTQEASLTEVAVKGLEANVTVQKHKTCVNACLQEITVVDPTPDALHPRILSTLDKEVFKMALTLYNHATVGDLYSDMEAVDMRMGLKVGCIRAVFLNKFVNNLLGFVDHFNRAKALAAEAGANAASAAQQAAEDINAKAPRIAMDIVVKAPVIVIPSNSTSETGMVADFGQLSVKNSFRIVAGSEKLENPAVIDTMHVALESMQLSRSIIQKEVVKSDVLILHPMCLHVNLARNLSVAWYHDAPAIAVSGKLDAIQISMATDDFGIVMSVLNENLQEGQPESKPSVKPVEGAGDAPAAEGGPPKDSAATETTAAEVTPSGKPEEEKPAEEPWVQVKADFEMEKIGVSLYTGTHDLTLLSGRQERQDKDTLGHFAVCQLIVGATVMSDQAVEAKTKLGDILLNDMRSNNPNAITRMIYRYGETDENIVDVDFKMSAKKAIILDAILRNLRACICTEFLVTCAEIFTKALPADAQGTKSGTSIAAKPSTTSQASAAAAAPAEEGTKNDMQIKAILQNPEIILVADSSTKDTNALILQASGEVNLIQSDGTMKMTGGLPMLRIDACPFKEELRKGRTSKVLVPCHIDFHLSSPEGQGQRISVDLPELVLNISPETVKILSAVAQTVSPSKAEEMEEKKKAVDMSDVWDVKHLKTSDFWFLHQDEGADVDDFTLPLVPVVPPPQQVEELVANIKTIVVKIEAASGRRFVPMLILEASMHAIVKDWSSRLYVESHMKLEVSTYNEKVAAWEPLIESIEQANEKYIPWSLSVNVVKNDDLLDAGSTTVSSEDEDSDNVSLAPPAMTVTVSAEETLQMTVTKTSLALFNKLGQVFGQAMAEPTTSLKDTDVIPACTVTNQTGVAITVKPGSYYQRPKTGDVASVKHTESIDLDVSEKVRASKKMAVVNKSPISPSDMELSIQVEGYEELHHIPIVQAGNVLYNLQPIKKSSEKVFSITLEIKATLDMRKVIVRSPLQIFNHFDKPVDIYTRDSTIVKKLGEVQPNESYVVPLHVAHTQELLAKPVDDSHLMCDQPILYENLWKEKMAAGKKQVTFRCPAKVDGYTPLFFNVQILEDALLDVKGTSLHSPKYNIHLHPVVSLRNLLPIPIYYTLQGSADEVKIEPCEQSKMFNVELAKTMMFVRIADYNGMEWRGEMTLRTTLQEYSQLGFRAGNKWTEAGVWYDYSQGFIDMAMFVPYTLINKTGLPIAYKGGGEEQIEHPADKESPIFFSYPSKAFSPGKNKIQLKVGESQWSDKFSLDTVGSSGFISCKMSKQDYEAQGSGIRRPKKYNISVQIQLSNLGFSKVVMFTPRYLLVNQTNYDICCSEPQGTFKDVAVGQCVPFWPVDKKENDKLVVMKKDGTETSLPFNFTEPQTTVLRLPEIGGIIVESQVTETATVIAFKSFAVGHFTTQLVNHTQDVPITFTQFGIEDKMFLAPREMAVYTWQNPTGKRQLVWTVDGKDSKTDLKKKACHTTCTISDGIGEVKQANNKLLYWVSFLNGTGRVILFTEDLAIATKAQQAAELEQPDLELVVSLPGIGLSLVNNISRTEVAYIGLISSGIIWQNKVRRRYKDLSVREMKSLEEGFVKAGLDASDQKDLPPKVYKLDHGMEVDYGRMLMLAPKKQQLRRTYHSGIWAQVRTSSHQLQLHLTINRLQVDNQMPAAIFPTPVVPVALPKTVAAENAPKQLLEFSMMVRFSEHSSVKQIKYLKLLVQEMAVKLDMGFLANVAAIFQSDEELVIDRVALLELDKELVRLELADAEYVKVALAKDFNFYDSFHLSPLKIHVSFSLSETGKEDKSLLSARANARQNALNLLLQSVGVTLTNVDDVIFKLGFFEREYQFYSPEQLSSEVIRHYSNQAIKQLYVLVLGLDVIGNPFGFVRGVGTGVKDLFYEPYQGIVQGPEEFAEGVALGMRSLFGHAVGGAAGAVSRITGTLGKGLAALTMDEDYKRKRQQAINQRPATFQEGLARGGKGLVMGFYEGVSGVVKNPFEGAKKEGAKGFFKGVGKGLAGVVAKPTGGIIDFASGTFEGIRRVVESEVEIHKLREPRYIGADGIIRAYNKSMALGNSLLLQVDKGKYAHTEDYVAHMQVTADKKNYILATDKRVIYTSRGEMLGQWDVDFEFMYINLKELPKVTEKGILIEPKEKEAPKKGPLGRGFGRGLGSLLKGKQGSGKMVHILDQKTAEVFVSKLHFAIAKATNAV
ncbi:vacuolar protein sorting-associated protein 13C isoform X3 [Strongylocentrotus purpuratus]|uniref:Vacuolar protein sorting-associated protein 13 n=1 Tax=Strongylocentrotus purpuratus TaxID=7668 RepID=A0A7M7N018_STRPU|nr:vacuolar protein sorting-associated protein 13C isoform X3 [Strongylocentrotus purpuratus]